MNAAQLNVVMTLAGLPWSFKLVYGFISDNFPIGGMRRKPYFIAGWTVYVLMNFITATQKKPRWDEMEEGGMGRCRTIGRVARGQHTVVDTMQTCGMGRDDVSWDCV